MLNPATISAEAILHLRAFYPLGTFQHGSNQAQDRRGARNFPAPSIHHHVPRDARGRPIRAMESAQLLSQSRSSFTSPSPSCTPAIQLPYFRSGIHPLACSCNVTQNHPPGGSPIKTGLPGRPQLWPSQKASTHFFGTDSDGRTSTQSWSLPSRG